MNKKKIEVVTVVRGLYKNLQLLYSESYREFERIWIL